MKRRRRIEKKNRKYIKLLPILALVLSLCISIGFSAFQETMLIGETVTDIVPIVDIKITNLSSYSSSNNGSLNNLEYDEDIITGEVSLPEENSTATMMVEVTNLQNAEAGILDIDITSDNDKLDYTIEPGYTKQQKICDDNNPSKCTLGAKKNIYITIKYAENKYDSNDTTDNFSLNFDFEGYYTVTYVNITGTYQNEVMANAPLEIDFGANKPYNVSITMGVPLIEDTDYTYVDGVLNINSVTGNTTVTGVNRTEGCFLVEALQSDNTKGKITAYDIECGLNVTIPITLNTSTLEGEFDETTCLANYTQAECDGYKMSWNNKYPGYMDIQRLGLISNFAIVETQDTVTIQEIGDYAFANGGINSLDLSVATGLTAIGSYSFLQNHLTTLTIPQNITSIGDFAFQKNHLEELDLSSATNLTTISSYAFSYNLLESINFSNSVATIGNGAFQYNKLQSITIPDSVTFIGNSAFVNNELARVYIGSGINTIDVSAFKSGESKYSDYNDTTYGPNAITSVIIDAHENDVDVDDFSFDGMTGSICWLKDDPTCNQSNN